MEDTNSELRSRSRSKTPFLRSSCDREHCAEGADHLHHKTGRNTPIKRSTPIKQIHSTTGKITPDPIVEVEEIDASSPAHRTRNAMKYASEKLIKTSDYSSEESLDRLAANKREIAQNEKNYKYESELVTTTSAVNVGGSIGDFSALSPIYNERSYHSRTHSRNASRGDKSSRLSPAYSACSTDSSFAEQALADASALLDDPLKPPEHLPYRLYHLAGEYWNKYPKTDFTYSPLSRDRVELAPGQVAVPNMSRRSLSQFRIQGPLVSPAEFEQIEAEMKSQKRQTWDTAASKLRKRYTSVDSSDDEGASAGYNYNVVDQRWWLTRIIMSIITTITETTNSVYHGLVGPPEKYPYRGYQQQKKGVVAKAGTLLSAPFLWVYSMFQKIVTNTITTVTETVTPNHVGEYNSYKSRVEQRTVKKTSWWPWLLLLLIPLIGYGCYSNYETFIPKKQNVLDTYEAPKFLPDSDLSKRVAALENWATGVDNKFRHYDQKIANVDDIEAKIESYSLKHLQNNIIQILNIDSDDGKLLLKLKQHFDKHYMSKNDAQMLSQEMHERLMGMWNPEVDEDSIRRIIQEHLAVYEKEQMRILIEKIKEYIKEVKVYSSGHYDPEEVKKIVAGMLDVYDADKIGKVDYALESAGGQVISTKCTELYQIKTKQYSVLGVPVWWVYTSPRHALTPGAMPAECWAFQGFPGYLVIRTYAIIEVTGFSLEHMSRLLAADGKIESAPKNFSVYGLRDETDPEPHLFGDYMYDDNGTSIQYFPVKYPKVQNIGGVEYPVAYDIVELRVESNHGNPTYTCVYRFRVHGNPLNDVRKATEDSIRDSVS